MNDRFDEVLDEAAILAELDAARAEVWVSGLLAEWSDFDDLVVRLGAATRHEALAVAFAASVMLPEAGAVAVALSARGLVAPHWAAVAGTAVAQQAWEIVDPFSGNVSVVVEYEHADLVRHSMLVEIEDASAVDIHFGPPGLVDAAFDESDTRSLSVRELDVASAIDRVARALGQTATNGDVDVTEEFVMNSALAFARVGAGAADRAHEPVDLPVVAAAAHRRERDAFEVDADAAACVTLRAALALALHAPPPSADLAARAANVRAALAHGTSPDIDALVADVGVSPHAPDDALLVQLAGAYVVPGPLAAFSAAAREAIQGLEWADWLGAVIPLVRGGVGADADPMQLVRNINRCGEVTTTVPKRDMEAIADVFRLTLHAWESTGVLDDDGRLTALGVWVLPRALLAAWGDVSDR